MAFHSQSSIHNPPFTALHSQPVEQTTPTRLPFIHNPPFTTRGADHTNPTSHWQSCLDTINQVGAAARLANLPTEGYFGISAATGVYGDAHVIYSLQPAPLALDAQTAEKLATPHVLIAGEKTSRCMHAASGPAHAPHMTARADRRRGDGESHGEYRIARPSHSGSAREDRAAG